MKQVFYKIASTFMAIVVLFSTMSFTVDMHYCGKTLVDASIFHKATTCGMKMQKSVSSSGSSINKKNCCSNKKLVVHGQNELKISIDNLTFDQQLFITSFAYTSIDLFESVQKDVVFYKDYVPLPLVKNLYKINETYLI